MPQDPNYYESKWKAAGVRYDHSFGAFSGDQLVAFIIHCVDGKVAFNTGTGVIPSFRGQHIVSNMYAEILPLLYSKGIRQSRLEVVTRNHTAINIYQRVGFQISRNYHCFRGNLAPTATPARLKKIDVSQLDWEMIPHQQYQSWDHQRNVVSKGPYQYYLAYLEQEVIGVLGINASFGYIALLELLVQDESKWENLLAAVAQLSPRVKVNNVDHRLQPKVQALRAVGLENPIDQFEMELEVPPA